MCTLLILLYVLDVLLKLQPFVWLQNLLTPMPETRVQLQNYTRKMEQKMLREEDLRMGLRLYKSVGTVLN
jgi:hypothetical protein